MREAWRCNHELSLDEVEEVAKRQARGSDLREVDAPDIPTEDLRPNDEVRCVSDNASAPNGSKTRARSTIQPGSRTRSSRSFRTCR